MLIARLARRSGVSPLLTNLRFSFGFDAFDIGAEELGGTDYISLNLYDLTAGPGLYPCEMPAEKVIAFLRDFVPDEVPS